MRKLVLMLKVNETHTKNAPVNLEISTHKGSKLLVRGNQATVLDVTDDEMSDSELQVWYRSRYSGFGMGISILHDEVKAEPVKEAEITEKKVEDNKPVTESVSIAKIEAPAKEDFNDEEIKNQPDNLKVPSMFEPVFNVPMAKVESKLTVEDIDKMTYSQMISYAKEHNIDPNGRGKEDYKTALTEWVKTHSSTGNNAEERSVSETSTDNSVGFSPQEL